MIVSVYFFSCLVLTLLVGIGCRTTLTTPCLWFLLLCLQQRNPTIVYGADHLIRLTLFWSCFVPWGKIWSVRQQSRDQDTFQILSPATSLLILQICFVVMAAGWEKTSAAWSRFEDGSAVWVALGAVNYGTEAGQHLAGWLQSKQVLVSFLTMFTLWWERLFFLILLCSRKVALFSLCCFAISIQICISAGLWPLAMLACATVLVPSEFWEKGGEELSHDKYEIRILDYVVVGLAMFSFVSGFGVRLPLIHGSLSKIGLAQRWRLFSRLPFRDGWVEVVAHSADQEVRLLSGEGTTQDWPRSTDGNNARWKRFHHSLVRMGEDWQVLLPGYCDFWREQAQESGLKVNSIEVVWHSRTHANFENSPFSRKILWKEDYEEEGSSENLL